MPRKRSRASKASNKAKQLKETAVVLIKTEELNKCSPIEFTECENFNVKEEPEDLDIKFSLFEHESDSDEEMLPYEPPSKIKRAKYGHYDRQTLLKAVAEIKSKSISSYKAHKKYKIPRSTLSYHLTTQSVKAPGCEAILSMIEEQRLVNWIDEAAKLGDAKHVHEILRGASDLVKILNKPGFKQELPSRKWLEGFKKRHPEVEFKTSKDEINYDVFYGKFHEFLITKNLVNVLERKDAFYIIEDTNFSFLDKPPNGDKRAQLKHVLAKKISGANYHRTKDSSTVTYTFSAEGAMMQPLMIFKDGSVDMMKIALTDQALNSKFLFSTTPDGGNSAQSFRGYLQRLIENVLKDVPRPIFIFCAETLPYIDFETHEWLSDKKVYTISFIPKDVSVLRTCSEDIFGMNNKGWSEIVSKFSSDGKISHEKFMESLIGIHRANFVKESIEKAFTKAGIYPFNIIVEPFRNNSDEHLPKISRVVNTATKKHEEKLKLIDQMKELNAEMRRQLKQHKMSDFNTVVIDQQLKLLENIMGR